MDNMSKGIEGEQIAARLIEQAISMAKVEAKLFQNISISINLWKVWKVNNRNRSYCCYTIFHFYNRDEK